MLLFQLVETRLLISHFLPNKIVQGLFNPNLYVDYENLIHFVIKVWTLEGRWDTGTNICQICAQWAACTTVLAVISLVQIYSKINHISIIFWNLEFNGLCHVWTIF